jgi:hypothetical protein
MKDKSTLLYEWRQCRLKLKQDFTETNLQHLVYWWQHLDYHSQGFDYDNPTNWPDVWEYISEGFYTNSGNGMGCFYSICHSNPDKEPELVLIHDLLYGDIYLVCIVDGWILNRSSGNVERFEDVATDIDILRHYTKEFVMDTLKFRDSV